MVSAFYEIDEVFNEAVMTGTPAIIVEGVEDISIYSQLSNKLPFDVEIYAVESIDGFGEGCEQVILAIRELNSLQSSTYRLADHVLGIIDKDVRDYRGDLPEIEPILTLNYYSIESHFVSKSIIKNVLSLCSKANRDLITEELCNLIMREIDESLLDLYYFSLESLKKSLNPGYDSSFYYSYSCGRINDVAARQSVFDKRDELDSFALSHGLEPTLDTLKRISKGKWLLDVFSSELLKSIELLQIKCSDSTIEKCKSCIAQAYDKCLYRIREGFTKKTIKSLALSNVDGSEFDYIVERISKIKLGNASTADRSVQD